ncbi:MAG: UDP-N-acetylmuramate dehydrogenase [Mucinivorans sp.]
MIFFKENFPLTALNTFGIAATAHYFCQAATLGELNQALTQCRAQGTPWHVMGGGSNTIFTGNFQGAIIQLTNQYIELMANNIVVADAGVVWDDLVEWSVAHDLQGLENLSAIPGFVGASPVQNIGAYGLEAGDKIEWVEYVDPSTGGVNKIAGSDCDFGYRHSIFKDSLSHCIVLRVAYRLKHEAEVSDFRLDYGDLRREVEMMGGVKAANVRAAVVKIRGEKLPDPRILGNAGSFFKNPIVSPEKFAALQSIYPNIPSYKATGGIKIPAGWLIDKAGLKGYREGTVGVHEKQALVIVNHGGATAADILNFAAKIENNVKQKYGITIDKEVTIV